MSTDPPSGPGLGDLEKELTCSICTDLLYQPLTLLDCLHTYCGSCLKEWFAVQGSSRRSRSSNPKFTCPSCRAVVRETRPNATVTTLLDMVLAANPEQVKSEGERGEIARRYRHGESVFPSSSSTEGEGGGSGSGESPGGSDDDRRLLRVVRERSLREGAGAGGRRTGGSRTRRAESVDASGANARREDVRARRRREEERAAAGARRGQRRQIEHQSSLRSLLSLSDTETMEEEILRQILEEGLLEDIDLDNLGPRQEEELSERIADAYRRRHRLGSRSQQRRRDAPGSSGETVTADAVAATAPATPATATPSVTSTTSTRPRARSQSVQRAPPSVTTPRETSRNPPVSRPYLLDPLVSRSGQPGHQRRLSDQGSSRRRTSPVGVNAASSSEVSLRPAARSSSDMIADRPRNSQTARVRAADSSAARPRRATASEQATPNIWVAGSSERELRRQRPGRQSLDISAASSPLSNISTRETVGSPLSSSLGADIGSPARPEGRSRPSSSRSSVSQSTTLCLEPSVSCDRCGKSNIQYDLHKKCAQCKDGDYHLCLRCYRLGRGCLDWIGFEQSAKVDNDLIRASSTATLVPPRSQHVLSWSKYDRPSVAARRVMRDGKEMTNDDPTRRLQKGLFCDICQSPANDCFWKCNQCNEGDWGFCNRCVNQGRCCTHALLPICRVAPDTRSDLPPSTPREANSSPSRTERETLKTLAFLTNCDICTHPIPPSTHRFHCLQCTDGDYDICANCYLKLVATGKIRKENGHNGWRRCLNGHRMVLVGFEDHDDGQRRVIIRDLVGGRALKDEHLHSAATSPTLPGDPSPEIGPGNWSWKEGSERRKKASRVRAPTDRSASGSPFTTSEPSSPISPVPGSSRRFPPDGGVGAVVHALWSWYPDGVQDELMFPRGADITEAENINDDWYWGCYAGSTGLFPGTHVFVVKEVV